MVNYGNKKIIGNLGCSPVSMVVRGGRKMAIICSLGNWDSEGQPHKNAHISATEYNKKHREKHYFAILFGGKAKFFFFPLTTPASSVTLATVIDW